VKRSGIVYFAFLGLACLAIAAIGATERARQEGFEQGARFDCDCPDCNPAPDDAQPPRLVVLRVIPGGKAPDAQPEAPPPAA
jgi:hypothetical protein